ncbi:initiation factor 2 subunit family protein [Cryptosporidium serpentis]
MIQEVLQISADFHGKENILKSGRANVDNVAIYFWEYLNKECKNSTPSCIVLESVVLALKRVVNESTATDLPELFTEINAAKNMLLMCLCSDQMLTELAYSCGVTNFSIAPICNIFESCVMQLIIDEYNGFCSDIELFKLRLAEKICNFVNNLTKGSQEISHLTSSIFVRDRMTVLTFGYSDLIDIVLCNAWNKYKKHYNLLIVLPSEKITSENAARKALIDFHHKKISEWIVKLEEFGVSVSTLPLDSIYNVMTVVDFVLIASECIFETGAIAGLSGTAIISSIAKNIFKKPVFVISYVAKFIKYVPFEMKTTDIFANSTYKGIKSTTSGNIDLIYSSIDISESNNISMIFTDIGALSPCNVAFELKQLGF